MHYKLISCEVFKDELLHCIDNTENIIDAEFIAKGIHDLSNAEMRNRIEKSIRQSEGLGFDAILLGYGLCNTWVFGLSAQQTKIVIPKSHDCIGILMGSKQKYLDYYFKNPGTYFQSVGWLKNTENEPSIKKRSIQKLYGMDVSQEELKEKYGEKHINYLNDSMNQTKHYSKMAFIDTGTVNNTHYQIKAKDNAKNNNWNFDVLKGNVQLLQQLVNGNWPDSEFLIINPGTTVTQSMDNDLIYTTATVSPV